MLYGLAGGISPEDRQMLQADLEDELGAVRQYGAHIAATLNPALQQLWSRIRQDEIRHSHWLQMALAGRIPGGMGQMGGMGSMVNMSMRLMKLSPSRRARWS